MLCIARKHLNYLTSRSLRSTKLLLLSNIICLQIVTPLRKLSTTLMRLKIFAPRDYLKSLLPFISKQDKKKILSDVVLGLIISCHWGNWILLLSLVKRWPSPHADSTLYRKSIKNQKSFSITKYRRHFRFVFKFMILWKYLEEKNIWKERRIRKKVTLTIFLLFPQ